MRRIMIALSLVMLGCSGAEPAPPTSTPDTAAAPASATTTAPQASEVGRTLVAEEPSPTLTVSGSGIAYGVPDVLTADLVVSVIRSTATEAAQVAGDVSWNVINALTAQGVPTENIRSSDYTLFHEYDYQYNAKRLLGLRVNHTYSVKMDLAIAGEAIDAAVAASWDALEVRGTFLSLDDPEPLIAEARRNAWADCRTMAREIAGYAGLTLGEPLSITEGHAFVQAGPYYGVGGNGEGSTTFEPGRISATAELTVQYAVGR